MCLCSLEKSRVNQPSGDKWIFLDDEKDKYDFCDNAEGLANARSKNCNKSGVDTPGDGSHNAATECDLKEFLSDGTDSKHTDMITNKSALAHDSEEVEKVVIEVRPFKRFARFKFDVVSIRVS